MWFEHLWVSVPSTKRLPSCEPVGEPAICRAQLVKYIPFTSLPAQHCHYWGKWGKRKISTKNSWVEHKQPACFLLIKRKCLQKRGPKASCSQWTLRLPAAPPLGHSLPGPYRDTQGPKECMNVWILLDYAAFSLVFTQESNQKQIWSWIYTRHKGVNLSPTINTYSWDFYL